MSQVLHLQQKAIQAAKNQDWPGAVEHNQLLLELKANDVPALNRLGAAYVQLKDIKKAKDAFEQVIAIDNSNKLARKNLDRIRNKQTTQVASFSPESFIEEPGKTKSVELYRLAGKDVLASMSIGQACDLQPKNRYVSVAINGIYVGALPEDLSFRLTKLLDTGNIYSCRIRSCNGNSCVVHLREVERSSKNKDINSFPANKSSVTSTINDVDESMLEEDIPVEIVHTDTDTEKSYDDFESSRDE
jgi:tetratricopeptide (TPR) repeat protein